jgi:hypothetical protein
MIRSTYTSIVVNSIRQLWRKKAYWVIQGLLTLGPVLISSIIYLVDPDNPMSLGVGVPGIFALALNYLFLPFLVAPAILDDFGKVGEILWSGPLDNLVYFAGRFSGLWLGLAAGSLLQLCGWFLASLVWFNILTEWVWLVSLVIYLLANFLGLCVVFLLAVLTRRTLPLMLGWGTLWVWFYYTVIFGESLAETFNPMISTAFTNIFFHNLSLSPSLGLGLVQGHVLGMFAWFLGLGLVALSLAFLLTAWLDPRRSTRRSWLAPILVILALLAAAGGYLANAGGIRAHAVPPSPQDVQVDAWQVLSQHTEVAVNAQSGTISGASEMVFSRAGEIERAEIVLRLNSGLELTAVSDESNRMLSAARVGDSVVIDLSAMPQEPVTLDLAWEGRLQIPYLAFGQEWRWYDAPNDYGFTYLPQALRGLIQPSGGYLLRDGDWIPWPWSTGPHQAAVNYLVIRPQGAEAAASVPLENGAAVWQGLLPEGLLVFLPGQQVETGDITLAMSRLVGRQHLEQARLFASAARRLAQLFEIPTPRYVIVLPYLNKVIWSGDLVLIPDSGGDYIELNFYWLYDHDVSNPQKQPLLARTTLFTLARAYLLDRVAPAPLRIKALLTPADKSPELVNAAAVSGQAWADGNGRWAQTPETFDYETDWSSRRRLVLNPQGEWSTVAFWLAMELAEEETRQADLDGLVFFDESHPNDDRSARHALMRKLIWPELLDAAESRALVFQLHEMTARLGTQATLTLLVGILQESQPETVSQLLVEMEQRSANPDNEVQP